MRLLPSAVVLLSLTSLASAQVQRLDQPPRALGPWPPGSAVTQDASQVFSNRDTSPGAFFQPPPGLLVMDWGQMAATPENEVFAMDLGYATRSLTPVDLTVRLHPLAQGVGDPGLVTVVLDLQDLPASTDGSWQAFTLTHSFDADVLPDGPFGWSYEVQDGDTALLLVAPEPGNGAGDGLDLYDGSLTFLTTVTLEPDFVASTYAGLVGSFPGETGWPTLGQALPGSAGWASLLGAGQLATGTINLVDLSGGLPGVTAWFVIGFSNLSAPFKGGLMIPHPALLSAVPLDGSGHVQVPWPVTEPTPAGVDVFLQAWFPDPGGPAGWASSPAVRTTTG